jgi:hypothetical protein
LKMGKKMAPGLLPITVLMLMLAVSKPGWAIAPAPPDLREVCQGDTCDTLQTSVCSEGYRITLTNFEPASPFNNNTATYKYSFCSPARGVCIADNTTSCKDNEDCRIGISPPGGNCSRDCAVDTFSYLTHFDVTFPELGNSCLELNTIVEGTCSCPPEIPSTEFCAINSQHSSPISLGDGVCFPGAPEIDGDKVVAKCDNILGFNPGVCITMIVSIASETVGLGPDTAVLADANACIASCLAGPSCATCEEEQGGPECLVRTKGFWSTHPNMASQYDPVTVCGVVLEGQEAGACSTSQALCTNANDYKENPPYLSFIAQLAAAKLNLNATRALFKGSCSTWEYYGRSIKEWIDHCEHSYCNADKQGIGRSGCIEALTAFNESQDTGFDVTPALFDQPGPADPSHCQKARGNGIFIGNCNQQPPPAHSKESIPGRGKGR